MSASTTSSPREFFQLNPPQAFTYNDFVIFVSRPRAPQGMSLAEAELKYARTRLDRLIRHVEARLGRKRCFFSEVEPRKNRKETQLEVTKLYAYCEVAHWPNALAHYQWTQFVMASIEYDAMSDCFEPGIMLQSKCCFFTSISAARLMIYVYRARSGACRRPRLRGNGAT
jgi:hypothetical protein